MVYNLPLNLHHPHKSSPFSLFVCLFVCLFDFLECTNMLSVLKHCNISPRVRSKWYASCKFRRKRSRMKEKQEVSLHTFLPGKGSKTRNTEPSCRNVFYVSNAQRNQNKLLFRSGASKVLLTQSESARLSVTQIPQGKVFRFSLHHTNTYTRTHTHTHTMRLTSLKLSILYVLTFMPKHLWNNWCGTLRRRGYINNTP